MASRGSQVPPLLQSLLVADHCYQDRLTGKYVIAGVFNQMFFGVLKTEDTPDGGKSFQPNRFTVAGFSAGSPFAFLSFTEVYGEQEIELRYSSLKGETVHFQVTFRMKAENPLQVVEAVLALPMLPREPGNYELSALWQNQVLGSYRIAVNFVEDNREKDQEVNDVEDH